MKRKKILFACTENSCRSQMASAFAQYYAGDKIEALCGGSNPSTSINPLMEQAMKEKGIDMGFRKPQSIDTAISHSKPDLIITMGCNEAACPVIPNVDIIDWNIPDPSEKPIEFMRDIRDTIEKKVLELT